jgi:hypothetical protein
MSLAAPVGVLLYGFAGVGPKSGVPTSASAITDEVLYVYMGVTALDPIASSPFTGTVVDVSVNATDTGSFPTMAFTTIGALWTRFEPEYNVPAMIPVVVPIVSP